MAAAFRCALSNETTSAAAAKAIASMIPTAASNARPRRGGAENPGGGPDGRTPPCAVLSDVVPPAAMNSSVNGSPTSVSSNETGRKELEECDSLEAMDCRVFQ